MLPPLSERVAVLETRIARITIVEDKVDRLDAKLDEVLIQLARHRTVPPPGNGLSRNAQRAAGGVIGAVLLYVLQAVAGAAAPALPQHAVQQGPAHQQTHEGP